MGCGHRDAIEASACAHNRHCIALHCIALHCFNAFKNRLDNYWTTGNQDVVYDYKSHLKGIGGLPVCA